MRKNALGIALTVMLALPSWKVDAAPVTYAMAFQSLFYAEDILYGAITLNDGVLGPVVGADIIAWRFTSADVRTTISSTDVDAKTVCTGPLGCFVATPKRLFFDFSGLSRFEAEGYYYITDYDPPLEDPNYFRVEFRRGVVKWYSRFVCDGRCGVTLFPEEMVAIGTAVAAPLEEPSTGALLGIGAVVGVLLSRKANNTRRAFNVNRRIDGGKIPSRVAEPIVNSVAEVV